MKIKIKAFILTFFLILLVTGCIQDSDTDSDNDKLMDSEEKNGWMISVYSIDGTMEERKVTSNPNKTDTDGDGLDDYEESVFLSDPSNSDTDNDGLEDKDEVESGSSIVHFDSWEINVKGISKWVIANYSKIGNSAVNYDSDYDGLSDSEEFYKGSDPSVEDTDGDGDGDFIDPEPCWNLNVEISLDTFVLKKNMDTTGGANLYFNIFIDDEVITSEVWDISKGEVNLDEDYFIDFFDRNAYLNNELEIQIFAFDEDSNNFFGDSPIEIDGSKEIYSVNFDIKNSGVVEYQTNGDEGDLTFSVEIVKN